MRPDPWICKKNTSSGSVAQNNTWAGGRGYRLRSARDHAVAGETALKAANQGHIRLVQGGSQAIRGFQYLGQGLSALLGALSTGGVPPAAQLTTARSLLARSTLEFLAADRAMGCPYGCHEPPAVKIP